MSIAFEISEDDVIAAGRNHLNTEISFDEAEEILAKLDKHAIEKAALYGNDMNTQTVYAVEAIAEQMKALGYSESVPSAGR